MASATWRIGHRGASAAHPENTLLAFSRAVELGANAVECDVHSCKSGEAVVIHDRTLNRTTNGIGMVSKTTLEALKKLDAGQGQTIPTLSELLAALDSHATIFIEIKSKSAAEATHHAIAQAAKNGRPYATMPVISYKPGILAHIQSFNPQILTGITPASQPAGLTKQAITRAVKKGMWSINPSVQYLEKEFVDAAHAAGLKIITWTANNKADIKKAIRLGADGIMSDVPELLSD